MQLVDPGLAEQLDRAHADPQVLVDPLAVELELRHDLHVPVGATVTWKNDHTQPHTATSAGNFDTGSIQPGESKTVTFDKAGTYSYICSFHPFMNATVTVG